MSCSFSYVVMACVVAGVGAVDGLHLSPAKVPVAHWFADTLYSMEQQQRHHS